MLIPRFLLLAAALLASPAHALTAASAHAVTAGHGLRKRRARSKIMARPTTLSIALTAVAAYALRSNRPTSAQA